MFEQLKKEFDYYLAHQEELVRQFSGKYIVIKDSEVKGAYDSEIEAVEKASEKFELGTFLVQKCEPGTDDYIQMYYSRVAFV